MFWAQIESVARETKRIFMIYEQTLNNRHYNILI